MIIAGEASGDLHGAQLVRAMHALRPDLDFFGIGGNALRQAGVDIRVDNSELAVVGISEVIPKINLFLKALRQAKQDLKQSDPALLILIDFPDFNLRVAPAAKKLGIPVMYYISPQVWAWRSGRVKEIRKVVDHMVVVFPFEVDFYEKYNVPVTFVGHPLLDTKPAKGTEDKIVDLRENGLLVGLLPGSRNGEVRRLLPTMVEVADILSDRISGIRFAIPVASTVNRAVVESIVRNGKAKILILSDGLGQILDQATLVITASGTVTLEAAIAGTPMIVVYKVSRPSYWIGKRMIRVKHVSLANLVAEAPIVPELIQQEASAEKIADEAMRMITDEKRLAWMRRELLRVGGKLGEPGASKRTAKVALSLLSED